MSIPRQRRQPPSVGRSASHTLLLATDLQQSVLSDLRAQKLNHHAYTPYGFHGGPQAAGPHLGFNGQLREPTGWYHLGNGHRVYNPVLMRFHSPDQLSPFGAGGINPYAYCSGSPVDRVDPSGKWWLPFGGGVVSGILSLVFTGAALNKASAAIVSGTVPTWLARLGNTMSFWGGTTGATARAVGLSVTVGQAMPATTLATGSSLATLASQLLTGFGAAFQNIPMAMKWMADATANGQSKWRIMWEALKEASGWNLLRGQQPGVVPGRPPDIPLAEVPQTVRDQAIIIRQGSAESRSPR